MPRSNTRRTLLLDLDGTLIGAHSGLLRASFITLFWMRMLRQGWSPVFSLRVLSRLRKALESPASGDARLNIERVLSELEALLGKSRAECEAIFMPVVAACFQGSRWLFRPIPGAREFLDWAKERFDLVLATNPVWQRSIVLLRLGWVPAGDAEFRFITHAGNMHACKPSVAYYQEILTTLGLSAKQCLMVGNDLYKEGPVRELGVPLFLYAPDAVTRHGFEAAGVATGSFEDLRRLLEEEKI